MYLKGRHYKLSFDVILDPLAHFCIKQLASYRVAVLMAIYSNLNLVKTHIMTISFQLCDFLALFFIQITLGS